MRSLVGKTSFTAVLLVGGLSTRMGRDKARLWVKGEPLWSRQLALLRELDPAALWVSAREAPAWLPKDAEFIPDEPPSLGPLSGVTAALNRLKTSHLVVLAVDLPAMTSPQLRKLAGLTGPGWGIVPRNEQYFEALAAVYPKDAASTGRGALASEDVSMQSFVRQLVQGQLIRPYAILPAERGLYQNANTSEAITGTLPGAS